jgi:RES domain-containing protein
VKGKFGALYLSTDVHTCVEEVTRSRQKSQLQVAQSFPRVIIGIRIRLTNVLDLTDAAIRRRLGMTLAVLRADWTATQNQGMESPTQHLGRLASASGIEGLLVPSAVHSGKNLVVFPSNLRPSSILELINPEGLRHA